MQADNWGNEVNWWGLREELVDELIPCFLLSRTFTRAINRIIIQRTNQASRLTDDVHRNEMLFLLLEDSDAKAMIETHAKDK